MPQKIDPNHACLFCQDRQAKMTGEHLWDDWLNKGLPSKLIEHFRTTEVDPEPRTWRSHGLDRTVKTVCEACNNGWMSDLSGEAKLAMEGMIRSMRRTCLLEYGAAVLVCFAFMKAAVCDHSLYDPPRFPVEARRKFFRTMTPPTGTHLWLSVFMPTKRLAGITYSSRFNMSNGGQLFVFTYTVGHVICQLVFPWHQKVARRRGPYRFQEAAKWVSTSIRAWPDPDRREWPPRAYLNHTSIRQFHERWG